MSNERFPRRVDLAIWLATLGFLGLALQGATAAAPATQAGAASAPVPAVAAPARATPASPRDLYQRECGDCHVAYAPRLLPAADWRHILGALDRHFGVDASLDAATTNSIASWLDANAGRARGGGHDDEEEHEARTGRATGSASRSPSVPGPTPAGLQPAGARAPAAPAAPLPRISTSPWFLREHDEIAAATWKRPAIGSAARCEACHTDAAQGRFSERAISIPR